MPALHAFQDFTSDRAFPQSATPTTALFTELLADACRHGDPMRQAVPVACLKRLIAARAWLDAAQALLAMQRPGWKIRRLEFDDGEWHCALSRTPAMPEWFDLTIEAHHPNMSLAIVSAMLAASVEPAPPYLAAVAAAPGRDAEFDPMLCENFA